MDRASLHLEIRNALSHADELSRHEHYLGQDELAGGLSALRSALADLEREVGRSHASDAAPNPVTLEVVERARQAILGRKNDVPRSLRVATNELLASAERVSQGLYHPTERVPSKPLLGVLPLARVIPQDVHSVLDYVHSAAFLASTTFARTRRAKMVGAVLGLGLGGMTLATDDRLGAKPIITIESHEALDYATAVVAIAAPFVLGYAKKDPIAAMLHIGLGVGTILTSLVTDYRAAKGITSPRRSRGGPPLGMPKGENGVRVEDVQRPLEGLSSAPSDWDPEDLQLA